MSSRERVRAVFLWPSVWLACTALCVLCLPAFLKGLGWTLWISMALGYVLALWALRYLLYRPAWRVLRQQPARYVLVTSALLGALYVPCCLMAGLSVLLVAGFFHP